MWNEPCYIGLLNQAAGETVAASCCCSARANASLCRSAPSGGEQATVISTPCWAPHRRVRGGRHTLGSTSLRPSAAFHRVTRHVAPRADGAAGSRRDGSEACLYHPQLPEAPVRQAWGR